MVKVFEIAPAADADGEGRARAGVVRFGEFRFDVANGLLRKGDAEIPLPPRALAVLTLLVRRGGQVVGKRELLDTVWKDVTVEEASLKEAISALRQTLGDDPRQPAYIQTVHRRGYRFVARTAVDTPPAAQTSAARVMRHRWIAAAVAVGVLAGVLGAWWWPAADTAAVREPVRFTVTPPAGDRLESSEVPAVSVSPDGSTFAFIVSHGEIDRLYLRALNAADPVVVAGSEGAQMPFFSPDSKWVGFCAGGMLKITPVAGGAVTVLAHTRGCEGAGWGPDGRIVYGSDDGLWAVSAEGGAPRRLTHINSAGGEIGHWWPRVLRDGSVLFTVWHTVLDDAEIALLRPGAQDYQVVFNGGSDPHYLPDGRLLIVRGGGAVILPFDLASGTVTGPPVATGAHVLVNSFMGFAQFAAADNGTRVMITGTPPAAAHMVWADAAGNITATRLPARDYRNAALSRDGRRVAVTINAPNNYDVWVGDLARGSLARLTARARNTEPVWSPDGKWVAYAYSGDGPFALMRRRADGAGKPQTLVAGTEPPYPLDFSPDGSRLAFGRMSSDNGEDIWIVTLGDTPHVHAFLRTPSNETGARFSPDGHWLAYVTDASGRFPGDAQVFLRTFPDSGRAWPVSIGSGRNPVWAPDGRSIYYQDGSRIMNVPLAFAGGTPHIGKPRRLFVSDHLLLKGIAPDGAHLLMIDSGDSAQSTRRLLVEVHG